MTGSVRSSEPNRALTGVEQRIESAAQRLIARLPPSRGSRALVEFLVFGAKQAWACIFGAAMLAVLLTAKLWYPDDLPLAHNDAVTIAAVIIQAVMIITRLETWRELRVVMIFHIVGTGMELFKTSVGSWSYSSGGVLQSPRCRSTAVSCTPRSVPTWSGSTGFSIFGSPAIRGCG